MLNSIAAVALKEGTKVAIKAGSKFGTYIVGYLGGFGLSQVVLPKMRSKMDQKMASEEWQKLSPEEQAKQTNAFNIKATVINGACNATAVIAAGFVDAGISNVVDKSKLNSFNRSYTIGTDYRI